MCSNYSSSRLCPTWVDFHEDNIGNISPYRMSLEFQMFTISRAWKETSAVKKLMVRQTAFDLFGHIVMFSFEHIGLGATPDERETEAALLISQRAQLACSTRDGSRHWKAQARAWKVPTSLGERLVIPRFGSWATGLRGKPSQGPGGTGQSLLPLCH